ncbi:MAG: DUF1800 family protein [Pseudomonadota bacterium]
MKFVRAATLNADGPATVLTVRAHGVLAGNVGPLMQLRIDDTVIDTVEVRATEPTDHRFTVPAMRPGARVDVVFSNDATVGGVDRNLFVTQVTAGDTYMLPTMPGVAMDLGTGSEAFDGVSTVAGQTGVYRNAALRFAWPAPNMTDRLIVRASGTLAGDVGPLMLLRVDGVVAGHTEVRSTDASDHHFAVPPLKPGSRIDLAYSNDAVIAGADRNLSVAYLLAGNTVLMPDAPGNTIDLGSGLAAFDGANLQAGQGDLVANGALRGRWPAANMTDTLTVRASGTAAAGAAPVMQVRVNGIVLGTASVTSATPADFSFPTLPIAPGSQVQVLFTNPGTAGSEVRKLDVAYAISGKTYLLASSGNLAAAWPEPNLTHTLTLRAKGSLAGNLGPVALLRINGVTVGSAEVRSTEFADYSFAVPPMAPGAKVDLVFTNDAVVSGQDRNLFVAYMISGTTSLLPTAAGAVYDRGAGAAAFDGADTVAGTGTMAWGGALRAAWPQPNITSTLTVRASATLAGNVGPVMRLWVDGVAVSSTEVRTTALSDHTLAAPALQPGSKIAISFDNPATVDDTQRRLQLAYLLAGSTVLKPGSSGVSQSDGNLQGSWPSPNLTDTLTVRAHGVLAGDVGPIMQVLVDGVLVGTTEVRNPEPTDHLFAVPAMAPGTKVEVVYTNDAVVNGVDRNLVIQQLGAGKTAVLPTANGVVFDRGTGAAAFDSLDTTAGQATLAWGGALRMAWPEPNLTQQITVRASGSLLDGSGPLMTLRVDGTVVGTVEVRTAEPADFVFTTPAFAPGSRIDVAHTNHAGVGSSARNLGVHYLRAGNTVLLPTASGNVFDLGSGLAAFDASNQIAPQAVLNANGALRGRWPAANMTDTLTVRASGTAAAGAAPVMQVRVNGIVLGTASVTSATPADFSFPTLPIAPGSQVQVLFTNPGTAGSEVRKLDVAYAISGKTYLLASSGNLAAAWPEPNLTHTLTLRAKGSLAGNLGPVALLRINGVTVGSAEVRSTEFADYSFAVPPMAPGAKVDLVFTNDAVVSGQDRNLFVAYMISGTTSLLPTAAGAVYDRGAGAAAFDGADTVAGTGTMAWGGALRAAWPQPNITSTLTVRASATLAGNVGPVMQVRVDGVAVSSVEVRATTPTDYLMPVPPLQAGSRIDLAYTNDAVVDGVDRNLTVAYAVAGSTVVPSTAASVRYDLGAGAAAFDDANVLPGQATLGLNGALRFNWPLPNVTDTLTVRASATLAAGIGALMQLRVNGVVLGTVEVRSATGADHAFAVPRLAAGNVIDLVFLNDYNGNGEDRNLFVHYIQSQGRTLAAVGPTVQLDYGLGETAFDGQNTASSTGAITGNAALRLTVPALTPADPTLLAKRHAASRFLQQASFGPTPDEINRLVAMSPADWLAEQMAIPAAPDFVNHVQAQYALGDSHRPRGLQYDPGRVGEKFWATAATSRDQLRKRVAFALHQIFMVSQADSNLYFHARLYARYLDSLNQHAFGNFRALLEDVALSPAMGIYLSHMRNRKEDAQTGRLPDENFARELMQLFTIGLHELNIDGSPKLDSLGQPIETYGNDDVMALAKVFTGWSWAFPDSQLTEQNFRWVSPDFSAANDQRIDLLPMKPYPGQHSPAEKRLFSGKAQAVVIPANGSARESVRLALDALFNHPNVGPFIGRQLIQRLVTSQPSAAYVARVAASFNNNGAGVRGDMATVVRAVLLDAEARQTPAADFGKLREPVLRVTHWMRAFGAASASGRYMLSGDLDALLQRPLHAPSVFSYFRPGYVPPNSALAAAGATAPELQIVSESTTAQWVNLAEGMAGFGLGWDGSARDVSAAYAAQSAWMAAGEVDALVDNLNLLLFDGRMSAALKLDLIHAMTSILGNTQASHLNRVRVALFIALSSPEYLVQR